MGEHRIGKTKDDGVLKVRIALVTEEGEQQTVDHGTVTDPLCLTISGTTRYSAGQVIDALDDLVSLAPGWTPADVASLKTLWQEWHLNTLKAGCAHVTPVYESPHGYRQADLKNTPPCPETGYRYGHAWLVKPLTPEAIAEITRLDALP